MVQSGAGDAPLNNDQKRVDSAIWNIVRFVNSYGGPKESALAYLNREYAAGRLNHGLRYAYEHCWDKKRADSKLTRSTYNNWLDRFKKQGHYAPAKIEKDMSIKPWHPLAVALRQRPQGSTKRWIYDQLVAQLGEQAPSSYDVLCNWFREDFSQIDQLKGRHTGSALRSHKFYQHRTRDGLVPAMEVHADGWNTHFTAPHPHTGEFVTYEVWHFHDVATRYVTQPGIGMTEQFEVIAKGYENFIRELGIPLILQTDSTKIIRGSARFTKDPVRSLEELVGTTIVHPKEVGNSQANGICENFNVSYLDKCSRELATYQAKDMDTLTFKRVRKLTAAMVKAAHADDWIEHDKKKREAERMGKGLVFTSYAEAVEWIIRIHAEYNNRPHRALNKIADPVTGKRRHQTPREALNEFIANGWEPTLMGDTLEAHEARLIDVFRPRVIVKVSRETVTPYAGMRFRNADVLGHWNGKEVVVVYDIHDWQSVRVEEKNGTLICVAEFVASTGYRAVSAYEAAQEKLAKAQIRHREKQIEQIKARNPAAAIEGTPVKTIKDFLDITPLIIPVPMKTAADFRVESKPIEKDADTAATNLWLYCDGPDPRDKGKPEDEGKEVAAS